MKFCGMGPHTLAMRAKERRRHIRAHSVHRKMQSQISLFQNIFPQVAWQKNAYRSRRGLFGLSLCLLIRFGGSRYPQRVYILLQLMFANLPRASGAIFGRSPAITPFVICSSVISSGTLSMTREVDCCVLDASILHLPYLSIIISCPSWRS